MKKKNGTAGTPVEPIAPIAANEADMADPGQINEIKAQQRQTKSGKYGSTRAKPFKPPTQNSGTTATNSTGEEEDEEKKTSWIEIELVGEDDKPIVGEKYKLTLPDGTVAEGTLDQKGWARVEGFEKGDCQVTFPSLDQDAWEYVDSGGSRVTNEP